MQKYFECKVRYEKQITDPNDKDCGKLKKITETYLVDALSFTEAEARISEEISNYVRGEYQITNIKQAKYTDIIYDADDMATLWYVCKIKLTIIDESRGIERKVPMQNLIRAVSLDDAFSRFKNYMKDSMSDYDVVGLTQSPIVDYIAYQVKEDKPKISPIEQLQNSLNVIANTPE